MIVLLPDLMDRADIWMVQGGSSAGFAAETFQCLWVLRQFVWQEFQGDEAAKVGVLGLVHHAHTAATELLDDAVVRDGLPNHGGRRTQAAMLGVLRRRSQRGATKTAIRAEIQLGCDVEFGV